MKSNIFKMIMMISLCICTFVFAANDIPVWESMHMTKAEYTQYLIEQAELEQAEKKVL